MSGQVRNFNGRRAVRPSTSRPSSKLTINVQENTLGFEVNSLYEFGKNSPQAQFSPKAKFGPVLNSTPRHQPYAFNPPGSPYTRSSSKSKMPKSPSHYNLSTKSNQSAMRSHIERSSSQQQFHRPDQNTPRRRVEVRQSLTNQNNPRNDGTPRVPFSQVNSPKNRASSETLKNRVKELQRQQLFQAEQHKRRQLQRQDSSNAIQQVVTQVSAPSAAGEAAYKEHLFQTFQAMKFIKNVRSVDYLQLQQKKVHLPKRQGYEMRKTVVFDLDETLVHCCENAQVGQVPISITFPSGDKVQASINIRPFAKECLIEANRLFEVIVFTASHQCYADVVLDYLDPTRELIHHRLYRENCVITDGVHIKDLRILQRKLEDVVIIDNAAYSFAYQLHNGIPIISWTADMQDRELFNLIDYLKVLAQVQDIRVLNRQTFHLDSFYEDYMHDYMGNEKKENQDFVK